MIFYYKYTTIIIHNDQSKWSDESNNKVSFLFENVHGYEQIKGHSSVNSARQLNELAKLSVEYIGIKNLWTNNEQSKWQSNQNKC